MTNRLPHIGEYPPFRSISLSCRCRASAYLVFCIAIVVFTQGTLAVAQTTACQDLQPGVVVESVTKNSEAEKAGIAEGDVITNWSRADTRGEIQSPFDLIEVETEQSPKGQILLLGTRVGSARAWVIGPDIWGLKTRPNLEGSLLSTYQVGQEFAKTDKLSEAIERWRASGESIASSCTSLTTWFLYHGAKAAAKARRWKESDSLFQAAIDTVSPSEPHLTATLLQEWADTFSQRNELDKAEERYRKALALLPENPSDGVRATILLNSLGVLARMRGDPAKAKQYYIQALDIQERIVPASLAMADTLGNLGLAAYDQGDLAEAQDYMLRALTVQRKAVPGSLHESFTLINLGDVAHDRGDLAKAEDFYAQALAQQQKFAPGKTNPIFLLNLGAVALDRGELAKAEDYFLQTVAIWQKLYPGTLDLSDALHSVGNTAYAQGDLAKAQDYFQQALVIQQKVAPDSLNVASTLSSLGDLAKQRGDLASAEDYFNQALAIQQKVAPDTLDSAENLAALGSLMRERHNLERSEHYYRQAIEIRKKLAPEGVDYAETLAGLAAVLRDQGNLDGCAPLYLEALDVFDRQMGMLGGSSNARAGFRAQHSQFYFEYADLLIRKNHPEMAFDVMERARSRTLLESLAEAHVDIKHGADPALIEKEHLLRATLQAKANRKIDLLSEGKAPDRIAEVNKEIDVLLTQYEELERQIRSTSPRYASLTQPKPITASEVQKELLDADTVLLKYILGDVSSYVFVVTSNSLDAVELPKRSDIDRAARNVYELLIARNRPLATETPQQRTARLSRVESEYLHASENLSTMVLGAVKNQIEGKRLLIVADGALHYIPFGALPAPAGGATQSKTPMIAEHEVVNLPSASVLSVLRQQAAARTRVSNKQLAVLADPVFERDDPRISLARTNPKRLELASGQQAVQDPASDTRAEHLTRSLDDVQGSGKNAGLARLVFSRREAAAIIGVVRPQDSLQALDFQASRQTATSKDLSQYRIVHFATHGLLDSEHPELSGLVLSLVDSSGKPQDGFLDLQDIYNLDLPADLVVLSACETGLGKEISGEGLVGLTQGFMYAGASRVVASLWKVDDAATAELMGAFYKAMLTDRLRPAAALRQAQMQLMKQKRFNSPYYWAAFTLQGDWN